MENRLKQLFEPEDVFVDIREHEVVINDPYKEKSIKFDDYVMLYWSKEPKSATFLGLNRVFNDFTLKRPEIITLNRKSFYINNSELFACMCALISNWITDENKQQIPSLKDAFLPYTWMNKVNAKAVTIDPAQNWFGFVCNLTQIKDFFEGHGIATLINELRLKGYSLLLIADNSVGNNGSFNIYLQISIGTDSYSDYALFTQKSLTLDKTNFMVEFQQKPEKLFQHFCQGAISIDSLLETMHDYSSSFYNSLKKFLELYRLMSEIKLAPKEYIALVLDLYDRNRNISSVELDERLRNLIDKTISQAINTRENEYTWKTLICNIIETNAEDFHSIVRNNPKDIKKVFSKKMVIQKMERIYSAVLGDNFPEKKMKQYIKRQVESYNEIKPLLI